jgi:hypothetical protein
MTNIHFLIISCSFFLRMINVSDKTCRANQNTHLFSNFFLIVPSLMWKNPAGGAGHRWQHIACSLHTRYLLHSHRLCNTNCFSTATMAAQMHLSLTLYVHCLCGTFMSLGSISLGLFIVKLISESQGSSGAKQMLQCDFFFFFSFPQKLLERVL